MKMLVLSEQYFDQREKCCELSTTTFEWSGSESDREGYFTFLRHVRHYFIMPLSLLKYLISILPTALTNKKIIRKNLPFFDQICDNVINSKTFFSQSIEGRFSLGKLQEKKLGNN